MYACLPPNVDPFFYDGEDLREIADEATVTAGLTLFKDHQVIACDQESDLLWGKVVDDQWDMPPDVQLRLEADGRLSFACACGQAVCAHQEKPGRSPIAPQFCFPLALFPSSCSADLTSARQQQ